MALAKFGKEIVLEVYYKNADGSRTTVLNAEGLRVDFDINNMSGFQLAKFQIYNLSNTSVKNISDGEKFISISVRLHGGELRLLGEDFFVTNIYTETILPNKITFLFCLSGARQSLLEKQVSVNFKHSSLEDFIGLLIKEAKAEGINVEYKLIPSGVLKYRTATGKVSRYSGSVESELKRLANMFHFNYYLEGNTLRLIYRADNSKTYVSSGLKGSSSVFFVDTTDLRSNPIIGIGSLEIELNLSPTLEPGAIIDTDNFYTATAANQQLLFTATDALKSSTSKYSKFQVYQVIHRGSNFTGSWSTVALGKTAKDGNRMSTTHFNWYGEY